MAELTPAQFLALSRRLATEADRLGDVFASELAEVLRRVERRLPALIAEANDGGRLAAGRAARFGTLRTNLRRLLTEAGYDDLADAAIGASLDRTLATLAARSEAYRQALAMNADGAPTAFTGLLRAIVETGRADLALFGDEIAGTLWRATVRGVMGATPPATIVEQLAGTLNTTAARAATLYDTNVSILQRISVQTIVPTLDIDVLDPTAPAPLATGGDVLPIPDDQVYAYIGPVDGLVRPFCLEHLGRVYTKAEIDALDNGQLPNTFLTGGGYNCRHLWAPISAFSEEADLQGTTGRVAEVEAEISRVKPIARAERPKAKAPSRLTGKARPQLPAPTPPPPVSTDPRPKARLRELLPDLGFTAKGDHATIYGSLYRDAERIAKRAPTASDMVAVVNAWAAHTKQLQETQRPGNRFATLAAIRRALREAGKA